jgi:hypothetical protein
MRCLAIATLCCISWSATAAQMTHEETIVRTAYAKLAYATEQDAVIRLAIEAGEGRVVPKEYSKAATEQRIANAQVVFTLSDFVVGNISDIANRKVTDFVSPAIGEKLVAQTQTNSIADGGTGTITHSIQLSWQPAQLPAQSLPPDEQDMKIEQFYERQWHTMRPQGLWQRYASYSVTVSYLGKARGPYKALFVFGHNADGSEFVEPEDSTTDAIGLAEVLAQPLFPDGLTQNRLRTYPVVADWLERKQMFVPSCSVGQHDVCCDLVKLKCGPGSEDLKTALDKPMPSPSPRKPGEN